MNRPRFALPKSPWVFICLCFALSAIAQQNTFRISYDVGLFDIPGGIIQNPAGNYILAGTNATIPLLYGNIMQLDAQGNIVWTNGYSASIATDIWDIKNASGGGYIATGSTGTGCMLMRLDNNGNVSWANRYRVGSGTSEHGQRVIQSSDNGFVVAGYVYDADPDGAGGLAAQDSANFFCMKVNSSGVLQWARVFFVTTAYVNDHILEDVAEVSDGYIFVGYMSQSGSDDDPSDAVILKTDLNGNLVWSKKWGGSGSSQGANSVVRLSGSEVMLSGDDNEDAYYLKVNSSGTATGGSIYAFPGFLSVAISYNAYVTNDGQYVLMGSNIIPFAFTFNSFVLKVNSSNGNVIFGRTYNSGLSSILPEGIQTADSGFVMAMTAQQFTGFNYHVVKSDKNGMLNNTNCPEGNVTPTRSNYNPSFTNISPLTITGASTISFAPVVVALNPTKTIDCQVVACTPPPTPNVSASQNNICAGTQIQISATGSGGNVTYNVFTTASGGTSIGTAPLNVSPSSTTTYYVEASDNTNPPCVSPRGSVTVTVLPQPGNVGAISGQTSPCPGSQGYSISAVSNATSYTWSVSSGGSISGGQGTTGITINWTTPGGPYTVSVTASNSCGSKSATLQVNVANGPPAAVGAITGNTTACPGSNAYSIAPVSGASTYTWSVSGGGNISAGQGTNSVSVTWTTPGGPYTVSVTASNSCGNSSNSTSVTVQNPPPSPPGSISGNVSVCAGSQSYSISPVTNATGYTWSVSGGGTITSNSTNATVNWTMTGTWTVFVTASNACGTSAATLLSVDVTAGVPVTPSVISGNTPVCPGAQNYSISSVSGATGYTWNLTGGGTITAGQGTTSVTVDWAAVSGTFTLSVIASNICGNSNPSNLSVMVVGGPPASPLAITGDINPCPGSETYTIAAVNGASGYQWTLSGGGTIISPTNTTSFTVDWDTSGGPYTISVLAYNSCGNSAPVTLNVTVQDGAPFIPSNITGDTIPCPGTEAYSINSVANATGYDWILSGGGTITSGHGTTNISVNWTTSGTHVVSVAALNACDTSAAATLNVNVQPAPPVAPGTINGSNNVCPGQESYSISSVTNATDYTWSVSGGGTILSGQSTTSVNIDWTTPGSFDISVTASNGCGTSSPTTLSITILPDTPSVPGIIAGPVSVCPGVENYSIVNVPDASGYTWSLSGGGTIASGQGTTSISINWTTSGGPYTISVTAENPCGTSSAQTLDVNVNPVPTLPSIALSRDTICEGDTVTITATGSTGGTITYNFYATPGGSNLLGTSPLTVTPSVITTYYLEVVNDFGCSINGRIPVAAIVLPAPANPIIEDLSICFKDAATLSVTNAGNATITWWDSSVGGNLLGIGNSLTTPALEQTTTYYANVVSASGCANLSNRFAAQVEVMPPSTIDLTSDAENNEIIIGQRVRFDAFPDDYRHYEFFLNGNSVQSDTQSHYVTTSLSDGDTVSVLAIDDGQCHTNRDTIIIKVREIANAFTPDGDGVNDRFLKGKELIILNRWGQELYEGTDGWDGKYDGKEVSPGTYFFIVTIKDATDKDRVEKGAVLLIRK